MKSQPMPNPLGRDRGFDGLKIVSRCPICQTEHNPLETAVLDEANGSHLIYIKCRKCSSGVVAVLTPTAFGVSSVGLVTDLSGNEIMKFKDLSRISADDVLAIAGHFNDHDLF
ncbi:MAG: hypothetical protein WC517_01495 [Patescibacteria group bacterium]